MRLMGIDYGAKRVGVALSDEEGKMAFPEAVLANDEKLLDAVVTLAEKKEVRRVILGESLDFKNKPNEIMQKIERFKRELAERGYEVIYEPEGMTSAAAARLQGKGDLLDASAAALILQGYIDRIKNTESR